MKCFVPLVMPSATAVVVAFLLAPAGATEDPGTQPAASGTTQAPDDRVLPKIEITANRPGTYSVADTAVATKTDTPLLDTPVSVQVLSNQLIQDQNIVTIDEALVNVAGAKSVNQGWQEDIWLRGFPAQVYLRDGFRIEDQNNTGGTIDLSNVDSIEVLKGPAAILYGRLEPGGVINIKTRQPQANPSTTVQETVGSWDRTTTNIDTTGPVDARKSLLYRVDLNYDQGNSWVQNVDNRKFLVAPTLLFRPDASTQVKLEASYLENREAIYSFSNVPFNSQNQPQWVDPSINPIPYYFNYHSAFAYLSWSHDFNDQWNIRQVIGIDHSGFWTPVNISTADSNFVQVNNAWLFEGVGLAQFSGSTDTNGTSIDLTGHFATQGVKHTLLAGADYYATTSANSNTYSDWNSGVNIPLLGPLQTSVGAITSAILSNGGLPLDPANNYSVSTTSKAYGAYVQDQLRFFERFDALVGLRYQNVGMFDNTGVSAPYRDSAVTPRLGAVWKADGSTSLYASYAGNFGATNGLSFDVQGRRLKPEAARQSEIGAKADTADHKSSATLALYDLLKYNVAAPDYENLRNPYCVAINGCSVSVGEIQSKGIEVTFQGEIVDGWNALLALSHDRTKVLVGTAEYPVGASLPYVSTNMLRAYSTYRFGGPDLIGWKVGGGATWQGGAPGTSFSSPAYGLADVMASYEFQQFMFGARQASLQVNVNNLFDKRYYNYAIFYVNPGAVIYGTPRSLMATLRLTF